ncbi:MAG: hypothetical protein EP338_05225 [Bacteroidetes bacterium]|nr:MAG: hypothetical protein EP338_05225 [Bacteroidota bacterium]
MFSFFGRTQNVEVNYLVAYQYDESVFLAWEIKKGSLCNGIHIERATSDLKFERIGTIDGVCGSLEVALRYDYLDESPFPNAKNYYRLEFGGNGLSDTVSIDFVDLGGQPYVLKGNPLEENSQIHFRNNNGSLVRMEIFHADGRKVMELEGKENFFNLNARDFESGVYHFKLSSEMGTPIPGTFLVR